MNLITGDLLLLHDASISTLKEKLHNEGRVSLSSLWTSVALHRSILNQLFRIIASTELLEAFQRVFHASQFNSPKENIDEKMNQYALLDLLIARYIKVQSWMSSNSNTNNVGWVILDSLLVHLEKARKMTSSLSVNNSHSSFSLMETAREMTMTMESRCHSTMNPNRSSSSLSAGGEVEEIVSDSLAKVIVILFLVKRVSLPLLERLQRRLLCLESDYETATPTVSHAPVENVPGITPRNVLSNISIYHGDKKRRESIKNGDVILFPPDIKTSPRHSHSNSNQLDTQSPMRSSTGSPLKNKRNFSTGSTSTFDEGVMTWDNNNTNQNQNVDKEEGEGDEEGMVLQGTVVPSLLLALERAINPIRLICHGSQVTHSSMLGFSNSSNDIPIYGKEVLHGTGLYGQGQGDSPVWTANCLKKENDEADKKSVRDNDVLRACRDTGARLLIPLNTADLDGLQLLVNSAIGRFTAIRAAVLSEINAWTNPEPLNIDHKALQHMMNLKFKKRGRIKLKDPMNTGLSIVPGEGSEGGEVLSPGPVSEAAVLASESISTPQTMDIIVAVAVTEVPDVAMLHTVTDREGRTIGTTNGSLGDGVDTDADVDARALAVLSALSTIALNTADTDDCDPTKMTTDVLPAAAGNTGSTSNSDSSNSDSGGGGDNVLVSTLPNTSPTPDADAGLHHTNGGAVHGPFGDSHSSVTQVSMRSIQFNFNINLAPE